MLKLIEKGKFGTYIFLDAQKSREARLSLQFFDGFDLDVGDNLLINEQLLDRHSEWFAPFYAFEEVKKNLKRVSETTPKVDLAIVKKGNKEYLLKRLYG